MRKCVSFRTNAFHVCSHVNDAGALVLSASSPQSWKTSFLSLPHPIEKSLSPEGGISTSEDPVVFLFGYCRNVQRERKREGGCMVQQGQARLGSEDGIISFLLPGREKILFFSSPRSGTASSVCNDPIGLWKLKGQTRFLCLSCCDLVLVWQQFSIIAAQSHRPWPSVSLSRNCLMFQ